jgi:hypothetical protein
MSDPKPKTKRRPAADRPDRPDRPRAARPPSASEAAPINPALTYRTSVEALVRLADHDPLLVAEAVTFWMRGGEAAVGNDANVTVLAFSPHAGAFADRVIDVDAAPGDADLTDRWQREDWLAAAPAAAWWAVYVDGLLLCATHGRGVA